MRHLLRWVLLVGAAAFRYYPHIPGPVLPEGTELIHITDDPHEAARAPVGTALVGEIKAALATLVLAPSGRAVSPPLWLRSIAIITCSAGSLLMPE